MAILVLKQNTCEIRKRIKQAGIELCKCTEFKDSVWLDYTGATPNKVHGVGYFDYIEGTKSIQEELNRFVAENKDIKYCKDVDEFINEIGNSKKVYDFKKPLSDKEKEVITKAQLNIINNYYFNNQ